jgi:ribosome-binding factor A
MPSGVRLKRIADRMREELSEMLIHGINDPRLKLIYVTDVKIDKELSFADIFVSAIEGVSRSKDVLAGLESASRFHQAHPRLTRGTACLPAPPFSLGCDA